MNSLGIDKLLAGVQYVHTEYVEGDIAEFGTASGHTAMALVQALVYCDKGFSFLTEQLSRQRKMLHLFDSFEGLPRSDAAPDTAMPQVQYRVWGPGAFRELNAQQLATLCETVLPKDRFVIHQGWYAETMKTIADTTLFALLHIDCDLYASTMDVLVNAFERKQIAKGAMILFDDWNCNRAAPELGERKAWAECVARFGVQFSDEGGYGLASHKFIVHSYH